jgi:hypothetical protein
MLAVRIIAGDLQKRFRDAGVVVVVAVAKEAMVIDTAVVYLSKYLRVAALGMDLTSFKRPRETSGAIMGCDNWRSRMGG